MSKKTRTLLLSTMIIMLCVLIISASSFALFTDSASIENHLEAGKLDLKLIRVGATHSYLDSEGYISTKSYVNAQVLPNGEYAYKDFTDPTDENVFGLAGGTKIVPKGYFVANMMLQNAGNVAYNFNVEIEWDSNAATEDAQKELSKQIKVTFTEYDANGNVKSTTTRMLYEMTGNNAKFMSGTMDNVDYKADRKFDVKVEFVDDDVVTSVNNNLAMDATVYFDLHVTAEQAITKPAP